MMARNSRSTVLGIAAFIGGVLISQRMATAYEVDPAYLEPQMLRLRMSDASLSATVSYEKDRLTHSDGSATEAREERAVQPAASVAFMGSVYHPYLLQFAFTPSISYAMYQTRDTTTDRLTGRQRETVLDYSGSMDILQAKPYALHLGAGHNTADRHDDFFTHQRVTTTRYDANGGYTEGPVPLSLQATHVVSESVQLDRPYRDEEDSFNASAYNSRASGTSIASYSYEKFRYTETDFVQEGSRQAASFADSESLGANDRYTLTSTAHYDEQSRTNLDANALTLRESFHAAITPTLDNQYGYIFTDVNSGEAENQSHRADASLRHKLYASLLSSLDVSGSWTDETSPGNSFQTARYSGGFSEIYTKKIPTQGQLSINFGRRMDWNYQDTSGGQIAVVNESHVLTDGQVTLLNQSDITPSSIVVTDPTGVTLYRDGFDYVIIPRGRETEIRRVVGGFIPDGATVYVSYNSISQPSDQFTSTSDHYGARIDLWRQKLGVFIQRSILRNEGSSSSTIQNIDDLTYGFDSTWRHVRFGVAEERYDADLSRHKLVRLFQTFNYSLSDITTLTLDMRQQQTTYYDGSANERTYTFMGGIHTRLARNLSFNVQSAAYLERNVGTTDYSRSIYTGTASADYRVGRLATSFGYQYQKSENGPDSSDRHYVSLSAQRSF